MRSKIICLFLAISFCSNALAKENSDAIELKELKERLAILEEKIAAQETRKKDSEEILVTLKPAGALKTGIDKTAFALDGRMQLDFGVPTKGKTSDNEMNASVRRLWLGATGNIDKDWSYRFIVGYENNQTSVLDAFVRYQGVKNTDIFIGNFFENNGLDIATGNLATPLMERSSGITTFRQFRRTGISINPYGDNWGLHFGAFGNNPSNSSTSAVNANNKGNGFANRAHIDLINDKKNSESLHLGFNNTYRWLSNGTNSVTDSNKTMRFTSSGDSNILNLTLIDSGNITNVESYYQNGTEFRYQNSSFTLTSEYLRTNLNRKNEKNVNFSGGYLVASYFISGEKYGYDPKQGIQTMPLIGNKGAWEIAGRYSFTNLNNGAIRGGKLNSYDFGINYYPNNNIKLMANYVFNRTDSESEIKQNPQYLMLRTQVSF
jgi:phosphate-selective porin OprO and OprP